MSVPNVSITILDNQLGIIPDSAGEVAIIMGCSSKGPLNKPAAFARAKDVQDNFGFGDAVESACYVIENTGKPIVFCKINNATDGYAGYLDVSGVEGSSIVTIDAASKPWDEYEGYLIVTTGGTIGTAGIKFRWSLDGGRTLSPVTGLGTANNWTFPNSGNPGIKLNFAAGDLNIGDVVTFLTDAPKWGASDIQDGMDAVGKSAYNWNFVHLVGPTDAAEATVFAAELEELVTSLNKYRWGMVNTRRFDIDETEGDYFTAISTDFADFVSKRLVVCYGYAKTLSSVSRALYRRPVAFSVISRAVDVDMAIDLGQVDLGPLDGVKIKDAQQNPDDHDEAIYPGADDERFTTLRSWDGLQGAYVNNAKLMSPAGSDFQFVQHRRVMDSACATTRSTLILRIGKAIRVDKKTGFILPQDKLEIESAVNSALRTTLVALDRVSDAIFVLNSMDNVISDSTLRGSVRITPLAYIKQIDVDIAFKNPAGSFVQV